jgi:FKBP-type peptidyl-prolyl cis-trans isomerase
MVTLVKKIITWWIIVCSALLVGCTEPTPQTPTNKQQQIDSLQQSLLLLNQAFVELEIDEINEYIATNQLDVSLTENGYWYRIDQAGTGEKAKPNQIVEIEYQLILLDGTICYTSQKNGTKQFRVGKFEVEKGLDDCIQLLSVGAEATCIIPSYLAHGVVGDRNCIPPRTPVVYRIKVISIKDN